MVPSTRYSAVRRQFGPTPEVEVPVLEYQMQVHMVQAPPNEMMRMSNPLNV